MNWQKVPLARVVALDRWALGLAVGAGVFTQIAQHMVRRPPPHALLGSVGLAVVVLLGYLALRVLVMGLIALDRYAPRVMLVLKVAVGAGLVLGVYTLLRHPGAWKVMAYVGLFVGLGWVGMTLSPEPCADTAQDETSALTLHQRLVQEQEEASRRDQERSFSEKPWGSHRSNRG